MTEGWAGTTAPELSRRIEALAAQAAAEARTEQELLEAVAQVRSEIAALRADVARVSSSLDETTRTEIAGLRGEVERVSSTIDETTRTEIAALRGDVTRVSTSIDEAAPPMEARLAALEDTLDGVAERLEAFARDGAATTSERLSVLARDVASLSSALTARTDELREFVADRTADSAATLLDAAAQGDDEVVTRLGESIAGLAGSVRDAIDAFAGSVERSLTALGTSVGGALADARDTHDDHLDEVAGTIESRVDRLVAEQQQAATALVGSLRQTATDLAEQGAQTAADIAAQLEAQQEVAAATRAEVTAMLGEVRTELGELVDGVRRQVQEELDALRGDVLGALADGASATRSMLVENERTAAGRIAEIKRGIDVHAHELDATSKHLASLAKTSTETKAVLGKMEEGWGDLARTVVEEAHAAAAAELDEFRGRMRSEIEGLRNALRETTDAVFSARGQLQEGTGRLGAAGEALLQYLAERDEHLEEVRDRVLHELLDDFASGLKPKERRGLADMLQTSRERAAQKRDADRWRKQKVGEAPPPPVPLVVAPPPVPAPVAPPEPVAPPAAAAPPEAVAEPEPEPREETRPEAAAPPAEPEAAAPPAEKPAEEPEPAPAKAAKPAKKAAKAAAKPAKKAAKPAKKTAKAAAKPAKKAAKPAAKAAAAPEPATTGTEEAPAAEPAPEPVEATQPLEAAPAKPTPAKPARKPAARRPRASVDAMPEVGSAASAIDAAVEDTAPAAPGPAAAPPDEASSFAPPTPQSDADEHDTGNAAIDAFAAAVRPKRGLRRR